MPKTANTTKSPKRPRLTDAQLVILSAAAARDDGALLPLPASLTLNKGAATLVLESLVRKGLAAERMASLDDETWRLDDAGDRLTLVITDQGLSALGIDREEECRENASQTVTTPRAGVDRAKGALPSKSTDKHTGVRPKRSLTSPDPKPGSKLAILIDLLQRDGGATTPEIMEATGWQAHSVRGAISGAVKKKLGLNVTSESEKGRGRVYRITRG